MIVTDLRLQITAGLTLRCEGVESALVLPVTLARTHQIMANPGASLPDLRMIGDGLGKMLTAGEAGAAFLAAREKAAKASKGWKQRGSIPGDEPVLRVSLQIDEPPLFPYPWENARYEGLPLFSNRAFPLVRVDGAVGGARPLPAPPIRVFAIAGTDDAAIGAREEIRELRHTLKPYAHLFDIEVFDAAEAAKPIDSLKQRLSEFKPHVLHFAGHAFDDPPALQLHKEPGGWSANSIGAFLANEPWTLHLAYLNACRTQAVAAASRSFVTAFCQRADAGALIAMSGNIQGREAGKLASTFYISLAEGMPADQALANARGTLGDDVRASYYPTLTVTAAPSAMAAAAPADVHPHLTFLAGREEAKGFVDRVQPRRQLLGALTANHAYGIAVVGDTENGKSWFLRTCLRCIAYQSYPVIYLEMAKYKTWGELLRSLLRGGDGPKFGKPLSKEREEKMEPVLAGDLSQSGRLPDAIRHTLEAIRPAPGNPPAVLIFDHLGASELNESVASDAANFFKYVFGEVTNSAADPKLRVIVACSYQTTVDTHAVAGRWTKVDLAPFPVPELKELSRDWFQAVAPEKLEDLEEYLLQPMRKARAPRFFVAECKKWLADMS